MALSGNVKAKRPANTRGLEPKTLAFRAPRVRTGYSRGLLLGRLAAFQGSSRHGRGHRSGQAILIDLAEEFLLARGHLLAQRIQVHALTFGLSKDAVALFF